MRTDARPEDGQPNVPPRSLARYTLRFAGGPVDVTPFVESHPGPTPSTLTGARRPDKMRDYWLTRANNATRSALRESNPLRRSALIEEARIATENAEIFDREGA